MKNIFAGLRMKSIYIETGGSSDVLTYGDQPVPVITDHQVLVKVKAAGVNPIDTKLRAAPERFPVSLPCIPGCDAAGEVITVGTNVTDFNIGDAVYFSQPGFNKRQGTYAEYVAVDASLLAHKPSSLTFEQAASAPLVLITAWEALHDRARIQPGQTVLIHAGAGGVGHVAIQLAKLAGANVITTVSNEHKAEFVSQLGAGKTIIYKQQNFVEEVLNWTQGNGVDIVFDTVGPAVLEDSFLCVKPYGDVVTILQPGTDINWSNARKRNLRFAFELMLSPVTMELETAKQHQGNILKKCTTLFDENKLHIEVAKAFKLKDTKAAHDFLEKQHPIGKLAIVIDDNL